MLGADVGTSGLKLVALDEDGAVVAEAEEDYEPERPQPGWAQNDVGTWLTALERAVDRLAVGPVQALGLSGQMHGAVLVDERGAALGPALLWPDCRAADLVQRWRDLPRADRAALANPLVPGMTGPLLAWLAAREPSAVAAAAAVVLPKDAVRGALVPGEPVTDRSDASATLLWDVVADDWSEAALGATGVPRGLLPAVRPSAEVVGAWRDVPVAVGGADTPLALLASGVSDGLLVNLGTGAQVLRPGAAPVADAEPVVHRYADVEGGWYAMAALQNGGSAWAWVRGVLGLSWAEFFGLAESGVAGRVRFRPFLTGERGGVAGPDDRGEWSGLGAGTTRADLARSAVEGVVGAVGAAAALLGPVEGPVVLTGGGGRVPLVRRLLADVLGRPVTWLPLRSASAIGAAVLAGRGIGVDVVPRMEPRPHGQPLS
nr:FGGY family carbohydrate kinase [Petropleomorpha daqingensis]